MYCDYIFVSTSNPIFNFCNEFTIIGVTQKEDDDTVFVVYFLYHGIYYYCLVDYLKLIDLCLSCKIFESAYDSLKEFKINIMEENKATNKLLDPTLFEVVSKDLCVSRFNKVYVSVTYKRLSDGKTFKFCYFELPKKNN